MTTAEPLILPHKDWLLYRPTGVGASEVPKLFASAIAECGETPRGSTLELWARKTGRFEDQEESRAIPAGIWNEPLVKYAYWKEFELVRDFEWFSAAAFQKALAGDAVYDLTTTKHLYPHPENKHLFATPDDFLVGEDLWTQPWVFEAKFTSPLNSDWKYGVPLSYQLQLQTQMACTGAEAGTVAALIGHSLYYEDFSRHKGLIDQILEAVDRFWWYVEHDKEPPADGTESSKRVLEYLHPEDSGELVELPTEAADWKEELDEINKNIREAEKYKLELQNKLRQALGDATYGKIPGQNGAWKWATQERKGFTVEPKKQRVLRWVKTLKGRTE